MFKDIYKSANDDVKADKSLLYATLAKAEQKKAPKIKWVYAVGTCAAAIVIVTAGIYSLHPTYEPNVSKPQLAVSEKQVEKQAEEPTQQDENEIEKIPENVISGKTDKKNDVKVATVIQETEEETKEITEPKQEEKIVSEAPKEEMETYEVKPDENEEISLARAGRMSTELTMLDIKDYNDYIGADIKKVISVPSDMEDMTSEKAYMTMDNGTISGNDRWSFIYTNGNDRGITVLTSRHSEYLENVTGEKKTMGNATVTVTQNEEIREAYFTSKNISFSVYAYGITDEEFEKLLLSLTN